MGGRLLPPPPPGEPALCPSTPWETGRRRTRETPSVGGEHRTQTRSGFGHGAGEKMLRLLGDAQTIRFHLCLSSKIFFGPVSAFIHQRLSRKEGERRSRWEILSAGGLPRDLLPVAPEPPQAKVGQGRG